MIQYNSRHRGAGIEWTGGKGNWLEGEEVGDGRVKDRPCGRVAHP